MWATEKITRWRFASPGVPDRPDLRQPLLLPPVEENTDAALSVEQMNRHDRYKTGSELWRSGRAER